MSDLNITTNHDSVIASSRRQRQTSIPNLLASWMKFLLVALLLSGTASIVAPTISQAQEKEGAKETIERKVAQEAIEAKEVKEAGEKAAEADGQDDEMEEDEDDLEEEAEVVFGNAFGTSPNKMMAAKKFQLNQTFAVELEVFKKIGDLDAKQMLKLKIAAKGTVKKIATKWKKSNAQMGRVVRAGGGGNEDDEDQEDEEEVVIKDADEIDQMTLELITMNNGNPFRVDDPLENKFWKKTVASVLTEEQSNRIKAYKSKRNEEKTEALIELAITEVAYELALDDDQKSKLAELVRPQLQDIEITAPSFYESFIMYYYISKVSNRKLKKFLTPAQLQKWKLFLAPAKQFGQMIEMENDQFLDGNDNGFFFVVEMILREVFGELEQALSELFGW